MPKYIFSQGCISRDRVNIRRSRYIAELMRTLSIIFVCLALTEILVLRRYRKQKRKSDFTEKSPKYDKRLRYAIYARFCRLAIESSRCSRSLVLS